LDLIPSDILKKSKILYLNYPNNPTGSSANNEFLNDVINFARENNIVIVYDNAYSEVVFDGERPRSILEIDGARDVVIEFHSLSKIFNMTGWRIGFACGGEKIISGFCKVKTNIDSGAFAAIQEVAGRALTNHLSLVEENLKIYSERRSILREAISKAGLEYYDSKTTFYLWVKVPKGKSSTEFSTELLEKLHIVATPGNGFGPSGEGYIRMSLTAPTERIKLAAERLKRLK
jgi:LL-diaminopimelate aminotransferase